MTWKDIDGWFDFQDVYDEMISVAQDGERLVEIGAWLGRSTAYLAQKAVESKKNIKIFAIDTWAGVIANDVQQNIIKNIGKNGSIFNNFRSNMEACGISNIVIPIKKNSKEAVSDLTDHQIAAVFIDGDHSYETVKSDLKLYFPIIKRGGIIAGHDFWADQIARAVKEELGESVIRKGNSFIYFKNED